MKKEKGNIVLILIIAIVVVIIAGLLYKSHMLPFQKTAQVTQNQSVVATSPQNADIAKDINSIQVDNPDNSMSDIDSDLQKL